MMEMPKVPKNVLFRVKRNVITKRNPGPSVADRLRKIEDSQLKMETYLKACAQYPDASDGTRKKWRKIALQTPGVIR